jgi:hypothetical protein
MFDQEAWPPDPRERLVRGVADLDPGHVAVVAELVDALARDPRGRTAGELTDAMHAMDRLHAVVDSATLRTWSAWEDTLGFVDDGHGAPGPWINANLCVRAGVARHQVGLARKLRAGFPHVGAAAQAGRLGRPKVELLVKARADDVAEVFDAEEAELVAAVEERTVEAADAYLATWRMEVLERLRQNDRDVPPPPERDESTLQLSPILEGRMLFRGELAAEDAALVATAVDARIDQWFAAGLLANDLRSRQELQAAALVALVRDGTAPAKRGNGARPLTLALIDADTLTARATRAHRAWLDQFLGGEGDPGAPDAGGGAAPHGAGLAEPVAWPPGMPPLGQSRSSGPAPGRRRAGGATGPGRRVRRRSRAAPPSRPMPGPARGLPPPGIAPGSEPPGRCDPPQPPAPLGPVDPHASSPPEPLDHARGVVPPSESGSGAGHPPDLDHGPPLAALESIRSHLARLDAFASSSPRVTARMPFRSEIVRGGPVDPAVIEELLCAGDLVPVVHRDHTEILDVGRAHRLATPVQRRALVVRSAGICEWPGCSIPHTWCDAHHLHFWEEGGPTDLANLALVCHRHHGRFHRAGYTGMVTATGLHVWRPDGTPVEAALSGRI